MRTFHSHAVARPKVFCLASLVTCVACAPDSEQGPERRAGGAIVRDSAQVRIVESAQPLLPSRWSVSTEAVLEIGVDENDRMQQLYDVIDAVVLSDRRVVVAVGVGDPLIRWYAPDGNYVAGAGRIGDGPGEFRGRDRAPIGPVWVLDGDSIAVWQHSTRRMQVFDSGGSYVRAVTLDPLPDSIAGTPFVVGHSRAGFLAYRSPDPLPGALGELRRLSLPYVSYYPDGSFRRHMATLLGPEIITADISVEGMAQPVRTITAPPFAKSSWGWLHEDELYYGSADRFEIAVYDLDGVLRRLIRRGTPRQQVTSAMISADVERRRANSLLADLPYPDSLPAHRRIRVDRSGWLWVQAYRRNYPDDAGAADTWSVFDTTGQWVTDLQLPSNWRILDVGGDYILVSVRGEFDVEHVKLFSLSRES